MDRPWTWADTIKVQLIGVPLISVVTYYSFKWMASRQ